MMAGSHGTTFGGNPFATTVGVATFTTMLEDRLPERADRVGTHLIGRLRALAASVPAIKEVRGKGLLIGMDLDRPAGRRRGRLPRPGSPRPDRGGEDPPHDAPAHRGRARRRPGRRDRRRRPPANQAMKHFLSIADLSARTSRSCSASPPSGSGGRRRARRRTPLAGYSQALVFEKPSLRTRVTFEVGMAQLGGASVYLAGQDIGLGRRESITGRGAEPRAVGRRGRRPDLRPGDRGRARASRRESRW